MSALFGPEFPTAMKFFLALVIVLLLIGAAAYLVRRFGVAGLAAGTQRNRQMRLAVVDSAEIDARRKLMIVRRDNVEHLLLIGGPNDVLVEANIMRAAAVGQPLREMPMARSAMAAEPAPLVAHDTGWPLAPAAELPTRAEPPRPEPVARFEHAPRPEPVRAEPPAPRIEPLRAEPPAPRVEAVPPRIEPLPRTEPVVRGEPVAPRPEPVRPEPVRDPVVRIEPAAKAPPPPPQTIPSFVPPPPPVFTPTIVASAPPAPEEPMPEVASAESDHLAGMAASLQLAPEPEPEPAPAPTVIAAVPPPVAAEPQRPASAGPSPEEQNLADMAHRLEAALRRPGAPQQAAAPAARPAQPAPAAAPTISVAPPAPRARPPAPGSVPPPPSAAPRPPASSYESLQREMASLLGRQSGSS